MKLLHPLLGGVVLGCLAFNPRVASALVPGQTGNFPTTGTWSATNWDATHSYVYLWNNWWNGGYYPGSAVAVGPNYLLTAGHVGATVGQSNAVINGVTYTAVSVITPPPDPGQTAPPDLALIKVDKTLPGYNTLYKGSFSGGIDNSFTGAQPLFLIGYGVTGTYNGTSYTMSSDGAGTERWGTNSVYWTPFRNTFNGTSSMIFGMTAYDNDTPDESFFGSGDSGGGTFVKVNGQWQLAGINAYAYGSPGNYGASSSIEVPAYYDWITANVPEPSGLLLIVGMVCLLGLRRRTITYFTKEQSCKV